MQRISTRMHNPRTSQTGNPRRPEKPTTTTRMDIIRIEIAHESILGHAQGLKRTSSASTAEVARIQFVANGILFRPLRMAMQCARFQWHCA
jgi:hypothetical protein